MSRALTLLGILGVLVHAISPGTSVPDATPVDVCSAPSRTSADIDRLYALALATPTTGDELEPHAIEQVEIPVGQPAGEAISKEISALMEVRAACVRDLNALGVYALYTDRYLVDLFAADGYPDWLANPGTPSSVNTTKPDYWLGSVDLPLKLEDGQVSAIVTFVGADIEDNQARRGVTYLVILQPVDGGWLIDRQYSNYVDATSQLVHPIADLLEVPATPDP